MVFYWSLIDNKSSQVFRTLLSILVDLDDVIVWMISTCPSISNTSSPLTKPFGIFPSAPVIIGITVTITFLLVLLLGLTACFFFRFL